jgi:hypothetical protein
MSATGTREQSLWEHTRGRALHGNRREVERPAQRSERRKSTVAVRIGATKKWREKPRKETKTMPLVRVRVTCHLIASSF